MNWIETLPPSLQIFIKKDLRAEHRAILETMSEEDRPSIEALQKFAMMYWEVRFHPMRGRGQPIKARLDMLVPGKPTRRRGGRKGHTKYSVEYLRSLIDRIDTRKSMSEKSKRMSDRAAVYADLLESYLAKHPRLVAEQLAKARLPALAMVVSRIRSGKLKVDT